MTAKLILLRHAERPTIPPDEVGDDVHLTENGMVSSFLFGQSLEGKITELRCSPVLRCVQTARQIALASGFAVESIHLCKRLGDPGIFIANAELAWQHWQRLGAKQVNQHLLSGHSQWAGFYDLDKATGWMLAYITETLESLSDDEIAIWVTHDTILATFASRVLSEKLTLKQWPDFLGHLVITKKANRLIEFNYLATANLKFNSIKKLPD